VEDSLAVCAGEVRPLERHRGKARAGKVNFHNAGCSAGAAPVGDLANMPGARRRLAKETFDPEPDIGLGREALRL